MSIEYVSPYDAFEQAGQRLKDPALQSRVMQLLGEIPPEFEELNEPLAIYAPYLAKGSENEVTYALSAAKAGFAPVVATYENTAYVTANPAIVDCYRAPLKMSRGQQVRPWVVGPEFRNGRLGDADTVYEGLDIVSYWRGLRNVVYEENDVPQSNQIIDMSAWYDYSARRFGWREGPKSPYYYKALMGLYASGRAVLFDTPPTSFAERVMQPADDVTKEQLGVRALLTCEIFPSKRDWTDISFLSVQEEQSLLETGRV